MGGGFELKTVSIRETDVYGIPRKYEVIIVTTGMNCFGITVVAVLTLMQFEFLL